MKAQTLALLSAAGMALSSVTVYSLTPPGGISTASADVEDVLQPEPGVGDETKPVAGSTELGRFETSAGPLRVEGRVGHARLAKNDRGETFVMLEVKGEGDGKSAPAPVNLSLVIDRSGSMRGSRLANALNAAVVAVDRLHDGDTVSVVAFDTKTEVVVPPTAIGPGVRERVAADIRRISLGGDTCISCGIEEGLVQLSRTTGRVDKMILLSDGEATAGVRDVPTFRSIAQRARDRGVAITTIGVDVDYNEKILAAVAQESNGRHFFVENDAALVRVFEQEAEALASTIATATEAIIDLAPGVELERVFDRSFQRAGNSIVVPLGSFAKDDTKTVLVKVRVPVRTEGELPVASVRIGWRDVAEGREHRIEGKLALEVVGSPDQASEIDAVVEGRVNRSETAAALQAANSLFEKGRIDEARRKLDEQAQRVRAASARAKSRAPQAKAKDVDRDFEAQIASLGEASSGFATPPPAAAGAAPLPAEESRAGKSAVKKNQESSVRFGF